MKTAGFFPAVFRINKITESRKENLSEKSKKIDKKRTVFYIIP